jgi:hypothetical protein
LIVELAVVTNTAPSDWRNEDDSTLATALDFLERRAEAERRNMPKGKRGRRG